MNLNKLTDDELTEMLEMYKNGSYTVVEIADWFGVPFHTIRNQIERYQRRKENL